MHYGLLGKTLSYSLSPRAHALLGLSGYGLREIPEEAVSAFFEARDFLGCNVTIPYKTAAFAACDRRDETAERTGSVNTVVREADGTLTGYNTDYDGIRTTLRETGFSVTGKKALVLGTGGTARTACIVLRDMGASPVVAVSRVPEAKEPFPYADVLTDYEDMTRSHADAAFLVNCTPVGMGICPGLSADPAAFPILEGVFDCIYEPLRTELLLAAEKAGIPRVNGLMMLTAQAFAAQRHFLKNEASPDIIGSVADRLRREMENVVLIGMPGSGKTTVGRMAARILDKTFVDLDGEIEKEAGEPVKTLLPRIGEQAFREMETEAVRKLSGMHSLVIATGGGAVTRPENYALLAGNGRIFFLRRDFEKLARDGRPLSDTKEKLHEMAKIRAGAYRHFADHIIDNNGELMDAVQEICGEILD